MVFLPHSPLFPLGSRILFPSKASSVSEEESSASSFCNFLKPFFNIFTFLKSFFKPLVSGGNTVSSAGHISFVLLIMDVCGCISAVRISFVSLILLSGGFIFGCWWLYDATAVALILV